MPVITLYSSASAASGLFQWVYNYMRQGAKGGSETMLRWNRAEPSLAAQRDDRIDRCGARRR